MNRIEIKVVRGLVEEQRPGVAEQRLRQQHANFLSALQLAHLALVQLVLDVEALQENRGVGLGGVAVFLAHDAFQARPGACRLRR